jgi:glycerol-3-phosphate dehydrogenase
MKNVLIIGGGATGAGIAAEAARRGFSVTLVERGGLGAGTSGSFHGMLHSGARYVVNDPAVAAACYAENQRLRRLIPSAIVDTGGLFVAMTEEEAQHADKLIVCV